MKTVTVGSKDFYSRLTNRQKQTLDAAKKDREMNTSELFRWFLDHYNLLSKALNDLPLPVQHLPKNLRDQSGNEIKKRSA